jgi:hypothetical protein
MTSDEKIHAALAALTERVTALEGERAVRNVLARYMTLCDQPCTDQSFPQLGDLFTADAVWEGVGELYTKTFGRQHGREAIVAFLGAYLAPSPHFKRNVHFLSSDQVSVDGERAHGQWLMMQASTYENGSSEAIGARLNIDFVRSAGQAWQMAHFRTQRLFCAPWTPELAALLGTNTGTPK